MSRLTNKLDEGFYVSNAPCTDDLKIKLGKLEDLEDELGCSLEVVFKALKTHKVCAIHPINKNVEEAVYVTFYYLGQEWCLGFQSRVWNEEDKEYDGWDLLLKDYGKTWWLKEDRSE